MYVDNPVEFLERYMNPDHTMEAPGDEPEKCHDLWKYSKIVSRSETGILSFDTVNFRRILKSISPVKNRPVSLVAIIGPKGSGKSFYTNLLIQYLKDERTSGWLTKLMLSGKEGNILRGFAYGNMQHALNLLPDEDTSGIYLYPEPFAILEQSSGKETIVWVLHSHYTDGDNMAKELDSIEALLILICSCITEIIWKTNRLSLLETRETLSKGEHCIETSRFCQNLVFLNRTLTPGTILTDNKKEVLDNLKQIKHTLSESLLANIPCISLANMVDCSESLHDSRGKLIIASGMSKNLEKVMKAVAADDDFPMKVTNNGEILLLGNMEKYLASSVELINRRIALIPKKTMNNFTETLSIPNDQCESNSIHPPEIQSSNCTNGGFQPEGEVEKIEVVSDQIFSCTVDAVEVRKGGISSAPQMFQGNNRRINPSPHGYSLGSDTYRSHEKLNPHKEQSTDNSDSGFITGNPSSGESLGTPVSVHRLLVNPRPRQLQVRLTQKNLSQCQCVMVEADGAMRLVDVEDTNTQNTNGKRSDDSTTVNVELQQNKKLCVENMPEECFMGNVLCQRGNKSPEEKNDDEAKHLKQLEDKRKLAEEKQTPTEIEAKKKATTERILTEVVETAFREMRTMVLTHLNHWVNTTLILNTINKNLCSQIYRRCLEKIVRKYKIAEKMDAILLMRFRDKLTTCTASFNDAMCKLDNAVQNYHFKLSTKFLCYGCFEITHLDEFIEKQVQSSLIGLDEQSKPYAERACKRLRQIYIEHNTLIVELEQLNANICTTKIRNLYKTAMDEVIGKGPFRPDELQRIHCSVSDKCLSSLKLALRFTSWKANVAVLEHISRLQITLNVNFRHYKTENMNMSASKLKQLNDFIKACKKQYDLTVDNCLQKNPNGIDGSELKKLHDDTQGKVKKMLENEIRNTKMEQTDLLKMHIKTLQKHISESWTSFMEENENCRKASSKTDEEEGRKKRREELESLTRRAQSSSSGIRDPLRQFEQSSQKKTPSEVEYPQAAMEVDEGPQPGSTKSKTLPPLLFQLSLSKVMMGVVSQRKSGFHFVDQVHTPALVAVTRNDVWIFGDDVEQKLRANGETEFQWVWFIGDSFKNNEGNENLLQEVTILGDKHVITYEFLLGLLLRYLKGKVENQMNGLVSKAIIIVPFWTTSCQRQGIKDAGTIAGFSNIFLISENSAVAYKFAKSTQETLTVVLSENSGQVDITLYTFSQYAGAELVMEGHSRVQNAAQEQQDPGIIQQIMHTGLQWYSGMDAKDSALAVAVDNAWTTLLNEDGYSFNIRHCYKVAVVISYETEKCRDVLYTFAQRIASSTVAVDEMHAALNGALLFSHNPASINTSIRDRLPYDILQMSKSDSKISVVKTKKTCLLDTQPQELSSSLKRGEAETTFYQTTEMIGNGRKNIGQLIMKDVPKWPFHVEPSLEVNNEGIVSLQHVTIKQFVPFTGYLFQQHWCIAAQYDWLTPNLSEERKGVFSSLVEPLLEQSTINSKVFLAKQALIQRAEGVMRRIGKGEGTFRSDVGRNMIIDEIKGIIQLLNHPKFSDFDGQNSVLSQISAKYSLN